MNLLPRELLKIASVHPSITSLSEASQPRYPRLRMTRSRLAKTLCKRAGLEPLPTGALPARTRLIVLDRFDYLGIVSALAILPQAEAVCLSLPLDLSPPIADSLEVWNCAGSLLSLHALAVMRLGMQQPIIVARDLWQEMRHHYAQDQVVLVTTCLESLFETAEFSAEENSYCLHMHFRPQP